MSTRQKLLGRKRQLVVGVMLALIIVLASAIVALAVYDNGLFELDVVNGVGDGNTKNDGVAIPGNDDWENVYNGTSSAIATAFLPDSFANGEIVGWEARTPEISFFTGGGSKDTECLQNPCQDGSGGPGGPWLYDTYNDQVPDKNDIFRLDIPRIICVHNKILDRYRITPYL